MVPLAAQGRRTYIASQRRPTGTALVVHLESSCSRASSGHISPRGGLSRVPRFWSLPPALPLVTSSSRRKKAPGRLISATPPAEPSVHRGIRFTGSTFSLRSAPPPLPRTVDGSDHTPRGRHSRTGFAIESLLQVTGRWVILDGDHCKKCAIGSSATDGKRGNTLVLLAGFPTTPPDHPRPPAPLPPSTH